MQNEAAVLANDYLKVGTTGIVGRTYTEVISDLGASTLGTNMFKLTNPSAITFPRFNANNTVSALSATDFRTAIGVPTSFSLTDDILDGSANKYARFASAVSGNLSSDATPAAGTSQLTWSGTFTANILEGLIDGGA